MAHYSFVVLAEHEVPIPKYLTYLDTGRNVFNVVLREDIAEFTKFLTDQGVRIIQANRLDEFEPVDPAESDLFDALTIPALRG